MLVSNCRTIIKFSSISKSHEIILGKIYKHKRAGYTYELSENLERTPSNGIGPTKKLFDIFLQTFSKIHLLKLHSKFSFNKMQLPSAAMIWSKDTHRVSSVSNLPSEGGIEPLSELPEISLQFSVTPINYILSIDN